MDFTDDEFDDDEDFIALTLKPPKPLGSTEPTTRSNTQRDQTLNAPTSTSQDSQQKKHQQPSELLVAKGEIAVLRSKIADLERLREQERDELEHANNTEKETSETKIKILENAVQRLEDERKFLSVEVRNLSNMRKKRRVNEESQTATGSGEDVEMTENSTVTPEPLPTINVPVPKPKATIKLAQPKTLNENSLFMDTILNHTIIGCEHSTMEYLSHITSPIPFLNESDPIFNIDIKIPLSTAILNYLVQKYEILRLDTFITKFSQNLTLLIQKIFQSSDTSKLSIPFLISLLHATVLFRPSAMIPETTTNLAILSVDLIAHHIFIVKKQDDVSSNQRRFAIPAIQKRLIDSLILVFSLDLLESLFMNCGSDEKLVGEIFKEISPQFRSILKTGIGSHSCLIVMFPLIETLIAIGHYDGFPEELILVLSQILYNGVESMQNMCFNGMNRILGDSESCQLISNLITLTGHSAQPNVVYSIDGDFIEHDHHLINLQLKICDLFEKLVLDDSIDGINLFNKDPVILKLLISTVSKQQELIFKSPRSNTTHLRSRLISSLIKVIHLIWEINFINLKTPPRITKDTTHELMITLSRIAFSANITSNEASEFLYELRKFDKDSKVFNKWSETRAREISHLYPSNTEDLNAIVNAEVGFSNGLEFAYDDIVVELARDILEKCTTMDEADNLYLSMNAV